MGSYKSSLQFLSKGIQLGNGRAGSGALQQYMASWGPRSPPGEGGRQSRCSTVKAHRHFPVPWGQYRSIKHMLLQKIHGCLGAKPTVACRKAASAPGLSGNTELLYSLWTQGKKLWDGMGRHGKGWDGCCHPLPKKEGTFLLHNSRRFRGVTGSFVSRAPLGFGNNTA